MHGTKLPVEERDLLGRRVDADLGGAQHLLGPHAPAVFATRIEVRRREVLTMWIVVTEINPEVGVPVPANNYDRAAVRVVHIDDLPLAIPVDDAVTDLLFLHHDLLNVLLVFDVLASRS